MLISAAHHNPALAASSVTCGGILQTAPLSSQIRQEAILSTQVLQDYFVTATPKLGLEAHVARQRVTQFGRVELIQPTLAMLLAAVDLQQNHSLSFWDVLIVQTASAARSGVFYSEDLQAGARIGNVLIVNPFA